MGPQLQRIIFTVALWPLVMFAIVVVRIFAFEEGLTSAILMTGVGVIIMVVAVFARSSTRKSTKANGSLWMLFAFLALAGGMVSFSFFFLAGNDSSVLDNFLGHTPGYLTIILAAVCFIGAIITMIKLFSSGAKISNPFSRGDKVVNPYGNHPQQRSSEQPDQHQWSSQQSAWPTGSTNGPVNPYVNGSHDQGPFKPGR